jgi:hypothetical protein
LKRLKTEGLGKGQQVGSETASQIEGRRVGTDILTGEGGVVSLTIEDGRKVAESADETVVSRAVSREGTTAIGSVATAETTTSADATTTADVTVTAANQAGNDTTDASITVMKKDTADAVQWTTKNLMIRKRTSALT